MPGFYYYNFQDLPAKKLKEKRLVPQSLSFQKIVKQSNKCSKLTFLEQHGRQTTKIQSLICFDKGKYCVRLVKK